MKGENALIEESTKICNQIKRSGKQYQNTELYEQCKNIQNTLNKYNELKDQFTIKNISRFFTDFNLFSKSVCKMNEEELAKSLNDYFSCKPRTRYYYFRVDTGYRSQENHRIGNGIIMSFSTLPKKVREEIEKGYSLEKNSEYFAGQTQKDYNKLRNNDYYMKIEIKFRGEDKAGLQAINSFKFNKCIFNFFTLTTFKEASETSSVYIGTDEDDNYEIHSYGNTGENDPVFQLLPSEHNINTINQILDKEKSKRNEIENKILLAVETVGTNSNSNVNVRFLFCMVAMEILVVGNLRSGMKHIMKERVAFLLGDEWDWVKHYRMMILQQPKNRKTTQKNSKIALASFIGEAYDKRSTIAHDTKSDVSEQYYYFIKLLLVDLVNKMLELLDQGMKCIEKNSKYLENESLWYFINQLKYK